MCAKASALVGRVNYPALQQTPALARNAGDKQDKERGLVYKSLRIAAAVVAATVGIGLAPAIPAMANPDAHGPTQPHRPGASSPQKPGSSNPAPGVNETPRGSIFDDIKNFFQRHFVSPCERIKCCNNSPDSRTIHC